MKVLKPYQLKTTVTKSEANQKLEITNKAHHNFEWALFTDKSIINGKSVEKIPVYVAI